MNKFYRELRARNIAKAQEAGVQVGDTAPPKMRRNATSGARKLLARMSNSRWMYFAPTAEFAPPLPPLPPKNANNEERGKAQKERRKAGKKAERRDRNADIMSRGRLPGSFENGKRR